MGTMASLIDAVVAKPPVALVTIVALPITSIGICLAHVAEDTRLQSMSWILATYEHMRGRQGLGEWGQWTAITVSNENVWMFVVWWIASFWSLSLVQWPRGPAEAEPMVASFAAAIAADADVVVATKAPCTGVVEFVLDVILGTLLARHVRLWVGLPRLGLARLYLVDGRIYGGARDCSRRDHGSVTINCAAR